MIDVTRMGQVTTANLLRDGTGTMTTLVTAGTYGSKVSQVEIQAAGTVTDGMIRIFVHDGTNARLLDEVSVTATTPGATVKAFRTVWRPSPQLELPAGWSLRVSTEKSETFNIVAKATDN